MRKLMYTLLELERESRKTCDFCSNRHNQNNKPVKEIITRREENNELIGADVVCEECKEKFLNDEIPKCERCGRLQTRHFVNVLSSKYICHCIRHNENLEEKELPSVPYESQSTFYERQINSLREELNTAETEIETHLEALEISEDWHKRQKQELLDEIDKLRKEVEKLRKQTPEELVNKIENYEKEIAELKEQVEQLTNQHKSQTEIPPKEKGLKGFFRFGGKK